MKLIIGLGNPGEKYAKTRHNAGFMVVDSFAEAHGLTWKEKSKHSAMIAEGDGFVLAKPQTFMNDSGRAVAALKQFYKTDEILVIADDIDRDFGSIRTRQGGGHGGNNGLDSIISAIGDDFARIRIAAKNEFRAPDNAAKFVLSNFTAEESKKLAKVIDLAKIEIEKFLNDEFEDSTKDLEK
jgi:PTH1 family peptidyl-tRNA hydrolase